LEKEMALVASNDHEARGADARRLLAVMLTPLFMYQADATIVNVANPAIRADLGTSGAELQLVVGGYLLASAMLLITGARLGQMRGYRRVFLLGLAGFGLASLACGLAPTAVVLVIARIAQGASGALLIPQVLSGIQVNFEGVAKTWALGLYSIALAGGAVAGQLLGGLLVSADLFGAQWRPVFLINVPIAAAVLIAAGRVLPADRDLDRTQRLDLTGVLTLAGGLLLILLPLTRGREQGWPAWTWACLATSVAVLTGFVLVEQRLGRRGGAPLLNLPLLRRPEIASGLISQALAISTYYALLFTLALYLQQGLGHSALYSGLTLVSWVAAFGVPGRLIGGVSDRLRPLVAPVGCLLLAGTYLATSIGLFARRQPEALLVILLGAGGFGLGMTFSAMLDHLTTAATPRYAADISGVLTTCLQVAGTIGVAAFGTVYFSLNSNSDPHSSTHAFAVITAAFAVTALGAASLAYRATRQSQARAGTKRGTRFEPAFRRR
jgi:MFS family permease